MGDKNQILFLTRLLPEFHGKALEVGSKDYGSTSSFRDHYPNADYLGIDLEWGDGVDEIVDLVEGIGVLDPGSFDLAICCSVMEHVRKPWVFADHLSSLLKDGGMLYVSVPWVWRFHPYPDDYWRFSWRGVAELYPNFDWISSMYSTYVEGEFLPVGPGVDDSLHHMKQLDPLRKRKYLPYLNVNMLGKKRPPLR